MKFVLLLMVIFLSTPYLSSSPETLSDAAFEDFMDNWLDRVNMPGAEGFLSTICTESNNLQKLLIKEFPRTDEEFENIFICNYLSGKEPTHCYKFRNFTNCAIQTVLCSPAALTPTEIFECIEGQVHIFQNKDGKVIKEQKHFFNTTQPRKYFRNYEVNIGHPFERKSRNCSFPNDEWYTKTSERQCLVNQHNMTCKQTCHFPHTFQKTALGKRSYLERENKFQECQFHAKPIYDRPSVDCILADDYLVWKTSELFCEFKHSKLTCHQVCHSGFKFPGGLSRINTCIDEENQFRRRPVANCLPNINQRRPREVPHCRVPEDLVMNTVEINCTFIDAKVVCNHHCRSDFSVLDSFNRIHTCSYDEKELSPKGDEICDPFGWMTPFKEPRGKETSNSFSVQVPSTTIDPITHKKRFLTTKTGILKMT